MENLIFSLNATVPVFLMMVIGMVLRRIGWVDEDFASKANKFVFRLPLPFLLFSDRSIRGEFIQVSYRSSAALLGIALIQNIYGSAGMAPLMILASVPLYNVMAVTVLSLSLIHI